MATNLAPTQVQILLARYKENSDQARHHELLRERSTAMVAATTGVMLGLLGFKDGGIQHSESAAVVALFVILLGAWGIFSSLVFESRARRHRIRIDRFLTALGVNVSLRRKRHELNYVWLLFHFAIVCLGVTVSLLVRQ